MKNQSSFYKNFWVSVPVSPSIPSFPFHFTAFFEIIKEVRQDPRHLIEIILRSDTLNFVKVFFAFFSMVALAGIITLYPKIVEAERKRRELLMNTTEEKQEFYPVRLEVALAHLESGNPPEWKLAVMEADNILAEVLKKSGCAGDTIGEMLKGLKRGDLASINDAWEAHKIRNSIAHEGSLYELSYRDAKRAINMYEKVFKELGYI